MTKKKSVQNTGSFASELNALTGSADIVASNLLEKPRFSDYIKTGFPGLDSICGGKGIPRGSMIEFFGWESCGKSYLAQQICAQAQKQYPEGILYIDLELSIQEERLLDMGIDLTRFAHVDQHSDIEELLKWMVDNLPKFKNKVSVCVVDSIAAMIPQGTGSQGELAKLLSMYVKKIHKVAYDANIVIIYINQLREDVKTAMNSPWMRTKPAYTPGGKAVRFHSQLRLDISQDGGKAALIHRGEKTVGHRAKGKVEKNKLGPRDGFFNFNVYYEKPRYEDIIFNFARETSIEEGSRKKIIDKRNDTYSFGDNKVDGEIEFKKEMISKGWIFEIFNALIEVGHSVDGITKDILEDYLSEFDLDSIDSTDAAPMVETTEVSF